MVLSLFTSERRLVSFVGCPSWLLTIAKSLESTTRLPSTSPSKRPIVTQAVATFVPASSFTSFAVTVILDALHETPVRLTVSVLPLMDVLATLPQLELARAKELMVLVKIISTVKSPPGFPERSSTPDSPVVGNGIFSCCPDGSHFTESMRIGFRKQLPGQLTPFTPIKQSAPASAQTSPKSGSY